MRQSVVCWTATLLCIGWLMSFPVVALGRIPPADTLFINGLIHTLDDRQPQATAVAVRRGRIVFVGARAKALAYRGPKTRIVDLAGQVMYPGFTDAHCHLFGIGERELTLNLEGTRTREAFLAAVAARVAQTPKGEWVIGRGWIETFWTPPTFPTAAELDAIAPDHPVFLTRADGHAAVVNSLALKLAGLDETTPNPPGGDILREQSTGRPTGMLIDRAQDLVRRVLPRLSPEDYERAALAGAQRELSLGWCTVHNAGSSLLETNILRRLCRAGKIKLRVYNAAANRPLEVEALLRSGPIVGEAGGRFTMRTIKAYMDGALGSRGAALLEPYADADTSGLVLTPPDDLRALCRQALRAGIQIQTHAIGDRANRQVLDIYEQVLAETPVGQRQGRDVRWRIEHAQILNPADIPRFARLGVIASMQPSHAISDLHFAPRRLGLERLTGAYAWRSLLEAGAIIAGGSDAPVERGEPLIEFYAAVTRKDLTGFSGEGWHPEQAVSRLEALKMLTLWPAYAAFEDYAESGTITVGKRADFTILSGDLLTVPEADILKLRCVMTVVGGEIVFSAK
ncbi:MAG: amidohydrolase [Chloracidobacterium sp.]|uniref:Amidohydrolase n=1 Tax=Chloracidobacterium validum TaxID=2821543 RepID=A0ABX8BA41_9BACT|nr:amidohydrolase [Chloracidobacterium validum]QUW02420.1 amidohydrolase [Chloracidobacterium validum]